MKQAENDATGAAREGIKGRTFELYGVEFVIPPGQSRDALVNAEGCLIDSARSVLAPGEFAVGEVISAGQVCAAHLILELLYEVNGAAQSAQG